MAMTRLSDPTPRMTLPRALLSEALRLARSPLTAVHLVCGLAAGLACGEYFSVTRWDPALGADAYAQFLGALMPLMSAIVCGLAVGSDYLPAFTAAALLALSVKNFARSFCNGYGFDAIFRASLYLGLLPFVSTAALPLLLILPPAVLLFRRTLREAVVAVAGVLLPAFTICYINWGAGGEFLTPLMALGDPFITGKPFALLSAVPLRNLVLLGGIFVLDLLALLFFLSDIYAVGTKSRTILIYNISVLVLTAAVLCGPAATPGAAAFAALPSAVLLPFMFVRIHRGVALLLYLLLLASAVAEAVLQYSI